MASAMLLLFTVVGAMFGAVGIAGAKFKLPPGGDAKAAGRNELPSPGGLGLKGGSRGGNPDPT